MFLKFNLKIQKIESSKKSIAPTGRSWADTTRSKKI